MSKKEPEKPEPTTTAVVVAEKELSPEEKLRIAQEKAREEKALQVLEARQGEIGKLQAAIQKDFGKGAFTPMYDHSLDMMRFSTGVLAVDIATGGGFPRGRITELFGPEESFKTSLDAGAIAMAQRTCVNCAMFGKFAVKGMKKVKMLDGSNRLIPNHVLVDCPCGNPLQFIAAHIDMEGTFDPVWFESRGVWLEHCLLSRPIDLEESIDIVQAVLESGQINLVSYDSIAAATLKEELNKSASDMVVGKGALKWNSAWRRWVTMQNTRYREAYDKGDVTAACKIPSIVIINQVRMKIGLVFGNPETTPGGGGGKFAASLRIRMQGGGVADEEGKTKQQKKKEKEKKGESDEEESGALDMTATHYMGFNVVKSKVSPKGGKGEFLVCQQDTSFHKLGEIDQDETIVDFGLKCGVISGEPNSYRISGVYENVKNVPKKQLEQSGGEIPLRRFRGKSEMEAFVAENAPEARRLYYEIVKKMSSVIYDGSMAPPREEAVDDD